MSDQLLVKHCSPTLAGMKTGNIFACSVKDRQEMNSCIRNWNVVLTKKGIRILPLRYQNGRALIYVYRPSMLSADLSHSTAKELLISCGYSDNKAERCIVQLIKRLESYQQFPHEIGLFLGYPPEDVYGFIVNKAEKYKLSGLWKVYGNAKSAEKTFEKYKKCTKIYCDRYSKGGTIEKLSVNTN